MKDLRVPLEQRHDFDDIIDVRTPLEFALDHVPGAINAPVLSNEERVQVGTLYKTAPFEATRLGAALVARNIAHHLDTLFADRPRHWRPLIYCWRGGKRSGAMTTWLNLIGWRARQLDGGYKGYRQSVRDALQLQPQAFQYIVLLGHTGSGKTRLLNALAHAGAQTLDLEGLAAHRGSLLGADPGRAQPSQKAFDTALVEVLRSLNPQRPVFIEAESRKIGAVTLPQNLLDAMHGGRCIQVNAQHADRVAFLLDDYRHLFDHAAHFKSQLERMIGLHSKETVAHWHHLIDLSTGADGTAEQRQAARTTLFEELIDRHYDPAYARSSHAHFSARETALTFCFDPNAPDTIAQAGRLIALAGQHHSPHLQR